MSIKKLPVSIIIPVCRDERVFECLESIDALVEIIVVLNGNYDKNIVEKLKAATNIRIYTLEEFNFSKIYNFGIRKASYPNIFFMDSDCIFKSGAIFSLYNKLIDYSITKGKVVFLYDNFIQKIIAKAREFTTSDEPNLYIPGPMFKKDIFDNVGLFNERIQFASDAEMAARIKSKNIKWLYVPEAEIFHSPLTIKDDLKSAFRYGLGRSQKHIVLNTRRSIPILKEIYFYFIKGAQKKGILVGVYLLFWSIVFNLGYIIGKIKYKIWRK